MMIDFRTLDWSFRILRVFVLLHANRRETCLHNKRRGHSTFVEHNYFHIAIGEKGEHLNFHVASSIKIDRQKLSTRVLMRPTGLSSCTYGAI